MPKPQPLSRDRSRLPRIDNSGKPADANSYKTVRREELIEGNSLPGPFLILEDHTLTRVKENWTATLTRSGSLMLHKEII